MKCNARFILPIDRGEFFSASLISNQRCRIDIYLVLWVYWVQGCKHVYLIGLFVWLLQLDFAWLQLFLLLSSVHKWEDVVMVRYDQWDLKVLSQVPDQYEEHATAMLDTTSYLVFDINSILCVYIEWSVYSLTVNNRILLWISFHSCISRHWAPLCTI